MLLLGASFHALTAQANPDLIGAAREGDIEAVLQALEASSSEPETLGRPLYFAAQRGHLEVVELLLEHGADANTRFTYGSPLHTAARSNYADVVAILLEYGADPNLSDGDFAGSPLHQTADRGATEAAKVLIENGADVNFRNNKGRPPIHNAAASENHDFVDFLRANGATPNLPEPIEEFELENADLKAGRIAMFGCNTCHEVAEGKPATGPHVGPTLLGVFGAPRGGREEYQYSKAMEELDGIWTTEALNAFLADPTGVVPGTEMLRAPDMTREERIGVIAILRNAAE